MSDNINGFKKTSAFGVDTGSTDKKFTLPTYEKTNTQGENAGNPPATPVKNIFTTTTVTPYGKNS